LITFLSNAQKGTVSGVLTDKDMNNEPLPFANALIKGTTIGTTTDIEGKFSLSVDPGNYILELSFLGYQTIEVPITIKSGQNITVNKALTAGDGVMLQDVVVVTSRKKNTEAAIMAEIKEAKQVVSAISAEQMSKGTDSNAADAIQRVPGVTIVDGRFVMIRGLSERYNNVLINNAVAPSTEVDKRTFAFDLIPTRAIDKMLIVKTGSADKPGDFSGGIINITTSENITNFNTFNVGFGFRNNTSFQDYYQSNGSKTDFLGFDYEFRTLPSTFPSAELINTYPEVGVAASNNKLQNNFNPNRSTALLDNSFGFTFGRSKKFTNGMNLQSVNSIGYSNSYQTFERQFTRYTTLNEGETRPPQWLNFIDAFNQNEVRITVLSNWILKLNNNNTIKFKNLFNQIGENETIIRNGNNFLQRGDDLFRNYLLGYKSRSIYSGQFEGIHQLNSTNTVDWVAGYNYLYESEPDLRRFRTIRNVEDPNSVYEMIDPSGTNLFDTGRYFGTLTEFSVNNGANYTHIIERVKNDEDLNPIKLKTGYYVDYRKRQFDSRYVSYFLPDHGIDRINFLKQLPLTEIFSPEYVNTADGWILKEGTRLIDSYNADNFLTAGYIYGEFPLNKFDVSGGVRVEHNILSLQGANDFEAVIIENPVTSILPSLNVGYNISERSILRFAYSKTVNRPEFREIAPFLFYDYENDANRVGNPNLETAEIDNLDFRYEFYPTKGETMSLGAFYKRFDNPIENVTQITSENPQFIYSNADSAFNYGLELEFRKSFKEWTNNLYLGRLSMNINASYIFSEVDLGTGAVAQDQVRALQGQSPYIVNVAVGYNDETGFSANVIYNRFGDRIFYVGDVNFPSIYELSRNSLDLTVSKAFKDTTVKLGVQNLLDDEYRFFEDSNRDEKIDESIDNATSIFKRGALLSLGVTHNF
jgi:outer membrane receptor for ferrienterochelin and colicin